MHANAKMHLSSDVSNALKHIEIIKQTVEEMEPNKLQLNVSDDLKLVLDLLQDPVFRNIVQIQDSLAELNHQITQHPSILPGDFDIANSGELVLSVPPGTDLFDADYQDEQRVPSAQISPGSPGPGGMLVVSQPKLNLLDHSQLAGGVGSMGQAATLQPQPLDAQQLLNASMKLTNEPSSLFEDHHHKLHPEQTDQHPLGGPFADSPKSVPETIVAGPTPADWSRILDIELVNDGTGLGFGIIGARTTGVTVKTILAGGVADRDGRLKSGDQILQIGDVNLHEMVSEQVASVLRQSGTHVQLVVARPIDPATVGQTEYDHSAIVPTVLLANPLKLKQYLADSGFGDIYGVYSIANLDSPGLDNPFGKESPLPDFPETEVFTVELRKDQNGLGITIAGYVCEKEELSGIFVKSVSPGSAADLSGKIQVNDRIIEVDGQSLHGFSNHQAVDVLKQSGHVVTLCLERYLRGPKYDQLQQAIAANEMKPPTPATPPPPLVPTDLSKYGSNILDILPPQALQRTQGKEHELLGGDAEEDLDETEIVGMGGGDTSTVLIGAAGHKKLSRAKDSIDTQEYREKIKEATIVGDGSVLEEPNVLMDATNPVAIARHHQNAAVKLRSSLKGAATVEEAAQDLDPDSAYIVKKWTNILGPEVQIIVANIRKFAASSGLGISLEGTVDVEGGKEVRPHHYIRSILPEGPVGQNGLLRSGDELLEVNGQRLLGMNHLKVVSILKELPQDVCMVCARGDPDLLRFTEEQLISSLEQDAAKRNTQHHHPQLHGSLTPSERLVKAKSDGSLATTNGTGIGGGAGGVGVGDGFSKIKSRSLEPLTGLAMWSSEPQIIELIKGERGLGFSILDYQDPLDPNDTLIVIRSLVPGGVAQLDGRLIPGDRLLFVNDTILENASLDQAVQALKGAPKGVVRIGVAKPLPMQDSSLAGPPFAEEKSVAEGGNGAMGAAGSGKMLSLAKPDIIME
ncbi:patj homolog isoform X2 [Anopheles stephensi]|uniref:patj homolog isoform X2 n=1 Tax=Anopheles stephensi TaxID=30069 RepID=UPI001658809E|nr:patj homolog isoform X2 [Anopheles stephensi]